MFVSGIVCVLNLSAQQDCSVCMSQLSFQPEGALTSGCWSCLCLCPCRYFVPNPSAAGKKKKGNSSSRRTSTSVATSSGGASSNIELPLTTAAAPGATAAATGAGLQTVDSHDSNGSAEAAGVMVRVSVAGSAAVSQGGAAAAADVEDVPQELELLKGINAFAVPGNLVALMGGSGAGLFVWLALLFIIPALSARLKPAWFCSKLSSSSDRKDCVRFSVLHRANHCACPQLPDEPPLTVCVSCRCWQDHTDGCHGWQEDSRPHHRYA